MNPAKQRWLYALGTVLGVSGAANLIQLATIRTQDVALEQQAGTLRELEALLPVCRVSYEEAVRRGEQAAYDRHLAAVEHRLDDIDARLREALPEDDEPEKVACFEK